jgi:hypothetical protein
MIWLRVRHCVWLPLLAQFKQGLVQTHKIRGCLAAIFPSPGPSTSRYALKKDTRFFMVPSRE